MSRVTHSDVTSIPSRSRYTSPNTKYHITNPPHNHKHTHPFTTTRSPDTKLKNKHPHPSIASVHPRRGTTDAADPQGSPPDRNGGSSFSAPLLDRGSASTPPAARSQPEVIEVDGYKAVLAISPAFVYDIKGEVYVLPADIVKAVHDLKVPDGYRREGCRERSFMYSPGVYVVPLADEDHKHKYCCMADPSCGKNKTTVPCKKGDRSNVNTHHKSKHRLREVVGAGEGE